jgi:thiol-disulfide isomerase/thioredoxin
MTRTNLITLLILAAILLCAGAITYWIYSTPNDVLNSDATRTLATTEDQIFVDLEGNPLTFDQFEGKVRVVNIWASWTPFSVQELKDMESLAAKYTDVAFIAVNRKEPKEQAQRFLSSVGELPHLTFAIDMNDTFYNSIGGYAMPETVFFSSDGIIKHQNKGPMTLEQMEAQLQLILSEE